MKDNDLIIPCSCGEDAFLRFVKFEDIEEKTKEVYISIIGQEIYGFKNKLKAIWSIITKGSYENFGVIVSAKDKKRISEYFKTK